ncbi:hypothetical protein [Chitinibacter sp. S2-10]|uniref:hypothetical protein n=1 Tax=Chitinibacter sp. S2-10 TaxID=3373597 RepID=UPI003977DF5B
MTNCPEMPVWFGCVFEVLTKITPVIIAALVAYIAWQQWQTAQSKFRLDLYNRRFVVYENTLKLFQALYDGEPCYQSGRYQEIHRAFIQSKLESRFLFKNDSGIFELLDELDEQSFKVTAIYQTPVNSNERELMANRHDSEWNVKMRVKIDLLEKKLEPYLSFHVL